MFSSCGLGLSKFHSRLIAKVVELFGIGGFHIDYNFHCRLRSLAFLTFLLIKFKEVGAVLFLDFQILFKRRVFNAESFNLLGGFLFLFGYRFFLSFLDCAVNFGKEVLRFLLNLLGLLLGLVHTFCDRNFAIYLLVIKNKWKPKRVAEALNISLATVSRRVKVILQADL